MPLSWKNRQALNQLLVSEQPGVFQEDSISVGDIISALQQGLQDGDIDPVTGNAILSGVGLSSTFPSKMASNLNLAKNVLRDYNASGLDNSTTGSITAGDTTLALNQTLGLLKGQGLAVYGAAATPSSQIPNPLTAPKLYQTGGSSSFVLNQEIWVAFAYRDASGNLTQMSPAENIIISKAGNKVQCLVPGSGGFAWGAYGVMIYTGSTSTNLVEYSYWDLNGGNGGLGNNGPFMYGYINSILPWDINAAAGRLSVWIEINNVSTGSTPPPISNTTNIDPTVTATVNGTAGTTLYKYWVCPLTWKGGMLVPIAVSATTTTGAASLTTTNSITLSWPLVNVPAMAVYGDPGNANTQSRGLLAIVPAISWTDTGAGPIPTSSIPPNLSSILPSASVNEYLLTQVESALSPTDYVLADAAVNTVSGGYCICDDSAAWQAAFNAAVGTGFMGGVIEAMAGSTHVFHAPVEIDAGTTNNFSDSTLGTSNEGYGIWLFTKFRANGALFKPGPGYTGPVFTQDPFGFMIGNATSWVWWEDVHFDGQRTTGLNQSSFSTFLYVLGGNHYFNHGCQINNGHNGIWLAGSCAGGKGNASYENQISAQCTGHYHVGISLSDDSNCTNLLCGANGANMPDSSYSNNPTGINPYWDALGCGYLLGSDNVVSVTENWSNASDFIIYGAGNVVTSSPLGATFGHMIQLISGAKNNVFEDNIIYNRQAPDSSAVYDLVYYSNLYTGMKTNTTFRNNRLVANTGSPWTTYRYLLNQNSQSSAAGDSFVDNDIESGTIQSGVNVTDTTYTTRVTDNPGFNPQAFSAPKPAIPAGIGIANVVTNTNPYPVRIYQAGSSGTTIKDTLNNTVTLPSDPAEFVLDPGAQVYYTTTVPTSWDWYGV